MSEATQISLRDRLKHMPRQTRMIVLTVVYALGAGLAAVAFQLTMSTIFRQTIVRFSHHSTWRFIGESFALTVSAGLVAGLMLSKFGTDAAGSGIPQLKRAFWKDFGFVPFRIIWVKFITAALQIGCGSSLGREGPSVQIAGAVASNLAGTRGRAETKPPARRGRRRGRRTGRRVQHAARGGHLRARGD